MKLYTIKWITPAGRRLIDWAGTQADAAKVKAQRKQEGIKAQVEDMEVPTDKTGLLAWLKDNIEAWDHE